MDVPEIYNPDDYKPYSKDIEYDMQRFKDPYVMGAMIHRLVEERKYTNAMLKTILKKLEELNKLAETQKLPKQSQILSELEEQILALARQQGKTTAEEVQKVLNYKGKNGASAKLNALHRMGLLEKRRAGKRVYFLPVS
jgi:Fic family protein